MIPVQTTTIRVLRRPADVTAGPFEARPEPVVIASGVRAQVSTGRGMETAGTQEVVHFRMTCDPVDLHHLDQVEDEVTGEVYEVQWARQRPGFGLDHTQAALKQVSGAVSTPRVTF